MSARQEQTAEKELLDNGAADTHEDRQHDEPRSRKRGR